MNVIKIQSTTNVKNNYLCQEIKDGVERNIFEKHSGRICMKYLFLTFYQPSLGEQGRIPEGEGGSFHSKPTEMLQLQCFAHTSQRCKCTAKCMQCGKDIIIINNPLTARVVGAPQMILQPVFSIFPCSPLPSGTCRTPGLSIP